MQKTSARIEIVAEGIARVQLPVPFGRLGDVNSYLLRDKTGWTVLDTGLNTPAARSAWRAALTELDLDWGDLTRIVLTHSDPDHIGLAGWVQNRVGEDGGRTIPVLLSEREHELTQYWSAAGASDAPLLALFRQCGVPEALLDTVAEDMTALHQATHPHPTEIQPLEPGDALVIGARRFALHATPGHSDGHIALHDAANGLILCGDQVLPHITPTISRWPSTEPNPLDRYLDSLRALETLDVRRALPGYGPAITDWTGRLQTIQHHHQQRLDTMKGAVNEGATVFDVARRSFEMDRLAHGEARFAIAETLAHLEYLEVNRHIERRGADLWRFYQT